MIATKSLVFAPSRIYTGMEDLEDFVLTNQIQPVKPFRTFSIADRLLAFPEVSSHYRAESSVHRLHLEARE